MGARWAAGTGARWRERTRAPVSTVCLGERGTPAGPGWSHSEAGGGAGWRAGGTAGGTPGPSRGAETPGEICGWCCEAGREPFGAG